MIAVKAMLLVGVLLAFSVAIAAAPAAAEEPEPCLDASCAGVPVPDPGECKPFCIDVGDP